MEDRPRRLPALRKTLLLGLGCPSVLQSIPARKLWPTLRLPKTQRECWKAGRPRGGAGKSAGAAGSEAARARLPSSGTGARGARGAQPPGSPGRGKTPQSQAQTPPTPFWPPILLHAGGSVSVLGGFRGVSASGVLCICQENVPRRSAVEQKCICKPRSQAEPRSHGLLPVGIFFSPAPARLLSLSFRLCRGFLPPFPPLKEIPRGWTRALPSSPSLPISSGLPPTSHFVASPLLPCCQPRWGPRAGGTHSHPSILPLVTLYLVNTPQTFQGVLIPL